MNTNYNLSINNQVLRMEAIEASLKSGSYESDQLFSIMSRLLVYVNGHGDNTNGINFANPSDPNTAWEIQQLSKALNDLKAYYTANPPTSVYDQALFKDFSTSYSGTDLQTLLADPTQNLQTLENWIKDPQSPLNKMINSDIWGQISHSSFNYNPNDPTVHNPPISLKPGDPTYFGNVYSDYTTEMSLANQELQLALSHKETDPTKGYLHIYLEMVSNSMQEIQNYFSQFSSGDNLGYAQIINDAFNSPLETSAGVIGTTSFASLLQKVTSGTPTSADWTNFMNAILPSGATGSINIPFGNDMGHILDSLIHTIADVRNFTQPVKVG